LSTLSTSAAQPRIVIVGGGFGGLSAARALARVPARVTLVDRRNHHVFQPLLYQVATAGLSPGDIASPIRWILRRQRHLTVLLGDVSGIDTAGRALTLADGARIGYDYLIVSAGASHTYFGHDDWEPYAPGLKTLEDGLEIRRRVLIAFEQAERADDVADERRLLTFVVVGGGPTGVELAGALAEISRHSLAHDFRHIDTPTARILLVEAGPSILPAFPEALRAKALASLARLGVEVRTATMVTAVDAGGVTAGGERIEAGTVLWAAGVAASPLGRALGAPLDRAGRVLVHPDLSIPDHPEVFVVGDLAAFATGAAADGRPTFLPGVAQVAMQQAAHAARNIARAIRGEPSESFHYRDYGNMATIGRASAVADFGWLRLSGYPAWLAWLFVHIMQLTGFRNRLVVLVQWAWAYLTFQRNVRLITEPRADRTGH